MNRFDWVEGLDGWRSGRYRIELVAPVLWVVSRAEGGAGGNEEMVPATVEATAGSLQGAKRAAEAIEARRRRRRRLRVHLVLLILASGLLGAAIAAPGMWTIPTALLLAPFFIRSALTVVDSLMGRPFETLKETYQ